MDYHVFIPSKGRAGSARCIQRLCDEGSTDNLYLFVEPSDYYDYIEAYPELGSSNRIIDIGADDMGITYVRNFMMSFAEHNDIQYYWQLDDDITRMGHVENKRFKKSENFREILTKAYKLLALELPPIAIGAMEYEQYGWSARKPYVFNSYCDTCVLINMDIMRDFSYTDNIKEDRDICIQVLMKGFLTARTSHFCFGSPKNGSNKGGLHEKYAGGLEEKWVTRMLEKWPQVCTRIVKNDGRVDAKVHWKLFKGSAPLNFDQEA